MPHDGLLAALAEVFGGGLFSHQDAALAAAAAATELPDHHCGITAVPPPAQFLELPLAGLGAGNRGASASAAAAAAAASSFLGLGPGRTSSSSSSAAVASSFLRTVGYKPDLELMRELAVPPVPHFEDVLYGENHGASHHTYTDLPRPRACFHGTNFGASCPAGWAKVGSTCQAPSNFRFTPECLRETGGLFQIEADLPRTKKRAIENQCVASWPCKGDIPPDYSDVCPEGWQLKEDGTCLAPPMYDGPCVKRKNFLMYTPGMKESWAEDCEATWPLRKKKADLRPEPKLKPDGPWPSCAWNYHFNCPVGYKLDANNICHSPEDYPSLPACAHADTRQWTEDMKHSFEKTCRVAWPCQILQQAYDEQGPADVGPDPPLGDDTAETYHAVTFHLGDRVVARDALDQLWSHGKVMSERPLTVRLDGETAPRVYQHVKAEDDDAVGSNTGPIGPFIS